MMEGLVIVRVRRSLVVDAFCLSLLYVVNGEEFVAPRLNQVG